MTDVFNATAAFALTAIAMVGVTASIAANTFLKGDAPWQDRFTFFWLAFDMTIHFFFEGIFVYFSTFGRTINDSVGPLADMWRQYAYADFRWGVADPTVVAVEILMVFGAAPLCGYILYQLLKKDPARHFWIIVLCTSELYGGWMNFSPEWLEGSPNLDTSNPLYLYFYLWFMNVTYVYLVCFTAAITSDSTLISIAGWSFPFGSCTTPTGRLRVHSDSLRRNRNCRKRSKASPMG